MNSTPHNSRLSGLDGLRGISILLVIMCHSDWTDHLRLSQNMAHGLERFSSSLGLFGVPTFFVISGFLITYLLLREEKRAGSVSLKAFWVRRFLRIIPPVMLYVLFVVCYSRLIGSPIHRLDLAAVILFFRDLVPGNSLFDHFWSLSIEEQFYLGWPLVIAFAPRQRRFQIGLIPLLLFPVLRILSSCFFSPPVHELVTRIVRFDSILAGCLLAIWWDQKNYLKMSIRKGGTVLFTGFICVMAAWFISYCFAVYPNFYGTVPPFKELLQEVVTFLLNIGVCCVIICSVTESSRWCAVLNMKWLAGIGVISYSLYLWQQFFFFAPKLPHFMYYLPVRIILSFTIAACGYYFVERPLTIYRHRIQLGRGEKALADSASKINPVKTAT